MAAALASSGTVLVIDDEEVVREAVADALESAGIRYRLAARRRDGVALFRRHAKEIGLVLLDLSMPGRQRRGDVRRPAPGGRGCSRPPLLRLRRGGGAARFEGQDLAGFLQKPYRFPTLLAEVTRCLRPRA